MPQKLLKAEYGTLKFRRNSNKATSSYMKQLVFSLAVSLIVFSGCQPKVSNLSLLGEEVPTNKAVVFGKDIVTTDNFEFAITFSPQMDELFFTRRKPELDNEIYGMRLVSGKWTDPEVFSFKATQGWDFEPHINPKGDRLYFGSTRPLNDTLKSSGLHQWFSKKTAAGWSQPKPLGKPFLDRSVIMYLTSSKKGNLYFTTGEKGDKPEDWVIYNSLSRKGEYDTITRMEKEINIKGKYIAHSFIDPDENYILFDGEATSGYGDCDIYVSFKKNGKWTPAVNLGPMVNTDACEMCPSVSPDGKYLFFHRGKDDSGDIYWISFDAVKENLLKPVDNN